MDASSGESHKSVLQKFAGTWQGEDGAIYRIEEGSLKCKRLVSDNGPRSFNLRWHSSRNVLLWGRSYFADPISDKNKHEILWYHLRDAKKRGNPCSKWFRKSTDATSTDNEQNPSYKHVLPRKHMLDFRASVIADERLHSALALAMHPYEKLGIKLDLNELPQKTTRQRKATSSSDFGSRASYSGPSWPGTDAHTDAMFAAEMWPQYMAGAWDMGWYDQAGNAGAQISRDLPKDESNLDMRTSVVIRNIKRNCSASDFTEFLAACGLQDRVNFQHFLRGSRKSGLAFVNFLEPKDILTLTAKLEDGCGENIAATKRSDIVASYARVQGQYELSMHFGVWPTFDEMEAMAKQQTEESSTEDSDTTKVLKRGLKADAADFFPGQHCGAMASYETTPDLAPQSEQHLSLPHMEIAQTGAAGMVPLSKELREQVCMQVEYYFSADNLCHDTYLRSMMDADGWVKFQELCKFPRMRRTKLEPSAIAEALSSSQHVEVSSDKTSVRSSDTEQRKNFGNSQGFSSIGAGVQADSYKMPANCMDHEGALAAAQAAAAQHAAWIAAVSAPALFKGRSKSKGKGKGKSKGKAKNR